MIANSAPGVEISVGMISGDLRLIAESDGYMFNDPQRFERKVIS